VLKLTGQSSSLAEKVAAMVLVKDRKHRGAAEIAVRHARDEAAVRSGRRSAKSLFVFPKTFIKKAKISQVTPAPRGTGW
jgi:hypothetical protein